jgi:hypothetical protein
MKNVEPNAAAFSALAVSADVALIGLSWSLLLWLTHSGGFSE